MCKEIENQWDSFNVANLHLLRMTRNTWSNNFDNKQIISGDDEDGSIKNYYLFDYFDRLSYFQFKNPTLIGESPSEMQKECDDNIYRYFMGIRDIENLNESSKIRGHKYARPSMSYQLQTLAELACCCNDENPFLYSEPDLPFIGIISVTAIPVNKIDAIGIENAPIPQLVLEYIVSAISAINSAIDQVEIIKDEDEKFTSGVYVSITSGNYFAVVRSKKIETIKKIALSIRNYPVALALQGPVKSLVFNTYTTVGIDYASNNISSGINYHQNTETILRLTTNGNDVIERLQDIYKKSFPERIQPAPLGLYGRYDISLSVPMSVFFQLFSIIDKAKFGGRSAYPSHDTPQKGEENFINEIKMMIEDKEIQIRNERPFIVIPDVQQRSKADNQHTAEAILYFHQNRIFIQSNKLQELIADIEKRRYELPSGWDKLVECMNLIKDIRRAFDNLRYEPDSIINGSIYYTQMYIFLKCISRFLDRISEDASYYKTENINQLIEDVFIWIKDGANTINSFNKMVQSINYQSMQSPNSEMQMRIDMEKYLIAYGEFLRIFAQQFYLHKKSLMSISNGDDYFTEDFRNTPILFPIFTVDASKRYVNVEPLLNIESKFPNDERSSVPADGDPFEKLRLLSITMPSTISYAKIHETLPAVCHEIAHNIRFINRNIRNSKLEETVIKRVAGHTSDLWITTASNGEILVQAGSVKNLLCEAIEKALLKNGRREKPQIKNGSKEMILQGIISDNSSITRAEDELYEYLSRCFFNDINPVISFEFNANIPLLKEYLKKIFTFAFSGIVNNIRGNDKEDIAELSRLAEYSVEHEGTQDGVLASESLDAITEKLDNNGYYPTDSIKLLRNHLRMIFFLEKIEKSGCKKEFDYVLNNLPIHINELFSFAAIMIKHTLSLQIFRLTHTGYEVQAIEKISEVINKITESFIHMSINQIDKKLTSITKQLISAIECHFTHNGYADTIQAYIEAYLISLRDVYYYLASTREWHSRHTSRLGYGDADYSNTREQVKKDILDNLHKSLEEKQQTNEISLYTSEALSIISSLHISENHQYNKDGDYAKCLDTVLLSVNRSTLRRLIADGIKLYDEIFADLCMSAVMQFDAFGYLRFLVSYLAKETVPSNSIMSDLYSQRVAIVTSILMKYSNDMSIDELINSIYSYSESVFQRVASKIEGDFAEKVTEMKDSILSELLDLLESKKTPSLTYLNRIEELRKQYLQMTPEQKDNNDLQYALDNLKIVEDLALYTRRIRHFNFDSSLAPDLSEHIGEVFRDCIVNNSKGGYSWENSKYLMNFRFIGDYYNAKTAGDNNSDRMFFQTTSFVLYYYHLNRILYSGSLGPGMDDSQAWDNWIEKLLTGGDDK